MWWNGVGKCCDSKECLQRRNQTPVFALHRMFGSRWPYVPWYTTSILHHSSFVSNPRKSKKRSANALRTLPMQSIIQNILHSPKAKLRIPSPSTISLNGLIRIPCTINKLTPVSPVNSITGRMLFKSDIANFRHKCPLHRPV